MQNRISKQFLHVIVDESQDLNRNQFRLFDAIASKSKMLVGDGKQSIYAFRNADVETFNKRASGGYLKLSKNFRSSESIINMVDVVFSQAFGVEKYFTSNRYDVFENQLSFDGIERVHLSAKSSWNELANFIAEERVANVDRSSTAILVRIHRVAEAIEVGLKSAGIDVRMNAGQSKFFARSEVRDLVNSLLSVSAESDYFAWLATLRSPIVGLSLDGIVLLAKPDAEMPLSPEDQEKLDRFSSWFLELRTQVDHVPASEVLSKIINNSDLFVN